MIVYAYTKICWKQLSITLDTLPKMIYERHLNFIVIASFFLITFVACYTSVSSKAAQTSPLYDATETQLTVMWTWYRTICTVNSWWWTPCDKNHLYIKCILTSAMLYKFKKVNLMRKEWSKSTCLRIYSSLPTLMTFWNYKCLSFLCLK